MVNVKDFTADPVAVAATDFDSLVAAVLSGLAPVISDFAKTVSKEEALKRYMRTYLRSLPKLELANELVWWGKTQSFSEAVLFHLEKASNGYDRYMVKHGYS